MDPNNTAAAVAAVRAYFDRFMRLQVQLIADPDELSQTSQIAAVEITAVFMFAGLCGFTDEPSVELVHKHLPAAYAAYYGCTDPAASAVAEAVRAAIAEAEAR